MGSNRCVWKAGEGNCVFVCGVVLLGPAPYVRGADVASTSPDFVRSLWSLVVLHVQWQPSSNTISKLPVKKIIQKMLQTKNNFSHNFLDK